MCEDILQCMCTVVLDRSLLWSVQTNPTSNLKLASSQLKGGTFSTWGLIMEFFSYLSFTSLVLEEYKASNSNPAHMGHNLTSKFIGLLTSLGPMTILTYSLSDGSTLIELLTTVS